MILSRQKCHNFTFLRSCAGDITVAGFVRFYGVRGRTTVGRLIRSDVTSGVLTAVLRTPPTRSTFSAFHRVVNWLQRHLWRSRRELNQTTMTLLPPASVRGMTTLDRDAFKKSVRVPSIQIASRAISGVTGIFKKKLLHVTGIKAIADTSSDLSKSSDSKLLLFDPVKCSSVDSFSEQEVALLQKYNVDVSELKWFDLELGYSNWGHSDILQAILPEKSDSVTGFSSIGHILHLNLKEEVMEYKSIIGKD